MCIKDSRQRRTHSGHRRASSVPGVEKGGLQDEVGKTAVTRREGNRDIIHKAQIYILEKIFQA